MGKITLIVTDGGCGVTSMVTVVVTVALKY